MLPRTTILSPRTASRSGTPQIRQRRSSKLLVFLIVAVVTTITIITWRFWPQNDTARLRYQHQLELGRQWLIDPEYAAEFWKSARTIAVENKWSTVEVEELLASLPPRKDISSDAMVKALSAESLSRGVTAIVNIQDRQGRSIRGLRRRDFQFRSGDRVLHHATVAETAIHSGKQSVAILVDCSGSMKDLKIESAKAAIPLLKTLQGPGVQFELLSFATVVERRVSLTTDWTHIESALSALKAEGATALYEAISVACDDLAKQPGQRRIVVIADGENSVGAINLDQVIAKCRAADVSVHSIGISGPDFHANVLELIARETGGNFYLAGSASDCAKELRRAVEAITTPVYRVMVLDAEPITGPLEILVGGSQELRVVVNDKALAVRRGSQTQ